LEKATCGEFSSLIVNFGPAHFPPASTREQTFRQPLSSSSTLLL
jgi:hypothetical protein